MGYDSSLSLLVSFPFTFLNPHHFTSTHEKRPLNVRAAWWNMNWLPSFRNTTKIIFMTLSCSTPKDIHLTRTLALFGYFLLSKASGGIFVEEYIIKQLHTIEIIHQSRTTTKFAYLQNPNNRYLIAYRQTIRISTWEWRNLTYTTKTSKHALKMPNADARRQFEE